MDIESKLEINNNTWEVKNNDSYSLPVLCSFPVNKSEFENVYFFEVELLADGNNMFIGWTTRLANFEKCLTEYQIMYNLESFKTNDIIGCLINLAEKNASIFHNGKEKKIIVNENCFDFEPFFATAFLPCNQHIKFNFENKLFKSNINQKYKTFDLVANKNNIQYSLLQPFIIDETDKETLYVVNYFQNNKNMGPFFNDFIQINVNELVKNIENQITDNF